MDGFTLQCFDDSYAKCGCISRAWQVLNNMSRKSLITWNSMIAACTDHGYVEDACGLFSCMLNSGVAPDRVTFLALLTAYAHKGMVDKGYRMFQSMQRDYGIEASVEHYGCTVDMLGRAGRIEEAYDLIVNMPIPSNDVVWEALLAACRIYADVNMAERVVKKLLELKPDEGGYYILLRDIYVASGRTAETNDIRQVMLGSGASKNPGCSWVGHKALHLYFVFKGRTTGGDKILCALFLSMCSWLIVYVDPTNIIN